MLPLLTLLQLLDIWTTHKCLSRQGTVESNPILAKLFTKLGLGTMATQAANNVAITGGAISGVAFSGSFSGVTSIEAGTFATSAAAAGVNLNGNTLAADGTDTNIDINTGTATGNLLIYQLELWIGKSLPNVTLPSFPQNVTTFATAAPIVGQWARGDRVFNNTPTVGQPKSWVSMPQPPHTLTPTLC